MSIPGSALPLLLASPAGAAGGYEIERSLRFNRVDSAYLSKTFGSAGNTKLWTFSFWYKSCVSKDPSEPRRHIFTARNASGHHCIINFRGSEDKFEVYFYNGSLVFQVLTTAVYRDPSAWGHYMVVFDTDQSTPANRVKMYANGVQITQFATANYPSQGYSQALWNSAEPQTIGRDDTTYLDGYLADVHFIDGQALTPTSFGEFDATTGVWNPIEYTGSYGTNGYYLNFADNSSAAALGYDAAGSNDWTVNNISSSSAGSVGGYIIATAAYLNSTNKITFPVTLTATTTYEFFARVTTPSTYIYFSEDSASAWNIGVNTSNSLLFGDFNGGYTTFTSTAIANGSWHFVRLTTTGSSTSLYVDGVLNATNASGGNAATGARTLNVYAAGSGAVQIAHLRITSGGTPPTTGIPDPSTMNTAAGSGGTLLLYDALDSLSGTGTITSDGGGVTITVTNAVSSSTADGTGNDSFRDSPTNGDTANDTGLGGEIPGNYATLNPLDMGANITLSNGNLDITATAGNLGARSTFALTTQKWYYEITINGISSGHLMALTSPSAPVTDQYPGSTSTNGWSWRNEGTIYKTSSNITVNGSWPSTTYTTGDVLMLAVDVDAGKVWLGKNGTWSNSGSPGTGANASITYTNPLLDGPLVPVVRANSTSVSCNFGQRAFAYSAPSGFKALCTANLDTPLIEDPSTVMDVALYTGNAPSTQTITGLGFSPDMVWIKNRSVTGNHVINDIVRGAGQRLITNLTSSESTDTDRFSAFTSDGFTVGDSTDTNGSSNAIVAWAWDAGTSNATNTSGSITSTVRANISAGFSVVTYNAGPLPAATGATVGHGLGIAPQFIVVKDRTNGNPWGIYHTSLGPGKGLLFSAAAEQVASTWWNNTAPTSSVFSINSDIYATAQPNDDYVAYCFAPVAGYSAFGSYTGNGSTDGPFVYTGFRPAFVLLKCSSASGTYWTIHDNKRLGYNPDQDLLFPNTSDSENSTSYMDFLSNGFKLRIISSFANASGATFIWAAFAESPFAYARAR